MADKLISDIFGEKIFDSSALHQVDIMPSNPAIGTIVQWVGGTGRYYINGFMYRWNGSSWESLASIPSGGTTGQVLAKQSNDDGDTLWKTLGTNDILLNSEVLSDGTFNITFKSN